MCYRLTIWEIPKASRLCYFELLDSERSSQGTDTIGSRTGFVIEKIWKGSMVTSVKTGKAGIRFRLRHLGGSVKLVCMGLGGMVCQVSEYLGLDRGHIVIVDGICARV